MEVIRETYRLLTPPAKAYLGVVEIYHRGHRDYIGALHYATARVEKIPLSTINYGFIDFLRERGYELEGVVLTPKALENWLRLVERRVRFSRSYSSERHAMMLFTDMCPSKVFLQ